MRLLKESCISSISEQVRVTYFGGKPIFIEFCDLAFSVTYPNSLIIAESASPVLEIHTEKLRDYLNENDIEVLKLYREALTGGFSGAVKGIGGRVGRALGYDTSGDKGSIAHQTQVRLDQFAQKQKERLGQVGQNIKQGAQRVVQDIKTDFRTSSLIQDISKEIRKDLETFVSRIKNNNIQLPKPGNRHQITQDMPIRLNIQGQPVDIKVSIFGHIVYPDNTAQQNTQAGNYQPFEY